jgi:heavy metal efflux system protein
VTNLSVNSLIKLSLQYRRYAVFLAFIAMLIGLWSLQNLPMEAYPDFTNPLVLIITPFPGKGAEEVERLVTIPLEKEMSGLPKETNVRSVSLFGLSVIYVTFEQGTKTQQARQLVLERMNSAELPDDVKPALDPDASAVGEIFRYTLESDYFSSMSMKTIQDWQLEKAFRQIPGVVDVTSFGGPRKTYQVFIDPGRLKAYNLTVLQVFDAIHSANITTGATI